jgi:hydroxymethylpyrimidine pyrophosphatase-like HAD family hydrolase
MIRYAGIGVAMGNAVPKLKEVADYITDTNFNDGVAKAIRKFVLD